MAKILVVDDEPALAELLRTNLEADGHEVHVACDGQEAVEAVGRSLPDLMILDVMMPRLDGWEVLGFLRSDPRYRDLTVIMLSVKDHPTSKVYGLTHGADDYLTKPFHLDELRARIGNLLRKGKTPEEESSSISRNKTIQPTQPLDTVPVQGEDGIMLVRPEEIYYVSAAHNSAKVASDAGIYTARLTLAEMEERLGALGFVRCHRSYLVNLSKVHQLIPFSSGTYLLSLRDRKGTTIPVSREQAQRIKALLGVT